MHSDATERTNSTAMVALASALFGFVCLLGSFMAILLGAMARREIARSNPPEKGGRLAIAAITLGVFQVTIGVVALGVGIAMLARFSSKPTPVALAPTPPPAVAPAPPTAAPSPDGEPEPRGTFDPSPLERVIGRITLVDVSARSGGLGPTLRAEHEKALASRGHAIVFVVGMDCAPCNGVALSLSDPRMQRAFAGSRLIRVHARERGEELERLGIPTDTVPGFALLAGGARPIDYLHGGEWDADIPDNIAPVLTDFVGARKRPRRYPWQGVRRPDETAL